MKIPPPFPITKKHFFIPKKCPLFHHRPINSPSHSPATSYPCHPCHPWSKSRSKKISCQTYRRFSSVRPLSGGKRIIGFVSKGFVVVKGCERFQIFWVVPLYLFDEYRKIRSCSVARLDSSTAIPTLRPTISGRVQGQPFLLLEPIRLHGLCPTDLARGLARH